MYKILPLALTLLSLGDFGLGCRSETGIKFTNYGFPDASGTPAYKCSGSQVVQTQIGDRTLLGDGSFDRPYAAAAAANSVFPKCELIYIPLLKKHFRIQDDCSGCGMYTYTVYVSFIGLPCWTIPSSCSGHASRPLPHPIQSKYWPNRLWATIRHLGISRPCPSPSHPQSRPWLGHRHQALVRKRQML